MATVLNVETQVLRIVFNHRREEVLQCQYAEIVNYRAELPGDHPHLDRRIRRAYALQSIEVNEDVVFHLKALIDAQNARAETLTWRQSAEEWEDRTRDVEYRADLWNGVAQRAAAVLYRTRRALLAASSHVAPRAALADARGNVATAHAILHLGWSGGITEADEAAYVEAETAFLAEEEA